MDVVLRLITTLIYAKLYYLCYLVFKMEANPGLMCSSRPPVQKQAESLRQAADSWSQWWSVETQYGLVNKVKVLIFLRGRLGGGCDWENDRTNERSIERVGGRRKNASEIGRWEGTPGSGELTGWQAGAYSRTCFADPCPLSVQTHLPLYSNSTIHTHFPTREGRRHNERPFCHCFCAHYADRKWKGLRGRKNLLLHPLFKQGECFTSTIWSHWTTHGRVSGLTCKASGVTSLSVLQMWLPPTTKGLGEGLCLGGGSDLRVWRLLTAVRFQCDIRGWTWLTCSVRKAIKQSCNGSQITAHVVLPVCL